MEERRIMKRWSFDLLTFVESETNNHKGSNASGMDEPDFTGYVVAKNISSGGLFFETEKLLELNTKVKIELILPAQYLISKDKRKSLIKVKGRIVRIEEDGVAVKFDEANKIHSLFEK